MAVSVGIAAESVKVAVLDQSRETIATYFVGTVNNSFEAALHVAHDLGIYAEQVTSEELEAGILLSSDFDILVLPDNVPCDGAIGNVLEWLKQGKYLVMFDSAFTFGLYAGLLFEELAGKLAAEYEERYWDYDSSDSTVIQKATSITEGFAVGEEYSAEAGDARLFIEMLPESAVVLGVDVQDPEKATIVLFRGEGTALFIGPDANIEYFPQLLGNAMLYVRDEEEVIEEISLAIASKGYNWEARTTSVSGLPEEDQKRLCGVKTEDTYGSASSTSMDSPLSVVWATAGAGGSLPSSVDWRNYQGSDWTTPIRNQGLCGSCVAHAALAVFESLLEIADNAPNKNPNRSENSLFFCGCGKCCDSGWYLSKAAEFLRDTGVPDESCWPYKPYDVSCRGYCSDCAQRSLKINSFHRLTSIEEMKRSLVENGPLLGRMDVYRDFFYYWGGIYRHAWGERRGAHAVAIVGFDDTEGCWIVKNSWGRWWGKQGWARIGYGEVGIEKYSYELKVAFLPILWKRLFVLPAGENLLPLKEKLVRALRQANREHFLDFNETLEAIQEVMALPDSVPMGGLEEDLLPALKIAADRLS